MRAVRPLANETGPEDLHNPQPNIRKKLAYPQPLVDHKFARERALRRYKTPGEK